MIRPVLRPHHIVEDGLELWRKPGAHKAELPEVGARVRLSGRPRGTDMTLRPVRGLKRGVFTVVRNLACGVVVDVPARMAADMPPHIEIVLEEV